MDDGSFLTATRARIDAIDREILRLLAERAGLVRALAAWKSGRSLPLRDPAREAAMIAARRAWAESHGLSADLAESVTRLVLAASRGAAPDDLAHFTRALESTTPLTPPDGTGHITRPP